MHTTSNHNTLFTTAKIEKIIVATLIPYPNPTGNTEKLDRNDTST